MGTRPRNEGREPASAGESGKPKNCPRNRRIRFSFRALGLYSRPAQSHVPLAVPGQATTLGVLPPSARDGDGQSRGGSNVRCLPRSGVALPRVVRHSHSRSPPSGDPRRHAARIYPPVEYDRVADLIPRALRTRMRRVPRTEKSLSLASTLRRPTGRRRIRLGGRFDDRQDSPFPA